MLSRGVRRLGFRVGLHTAGMMPDQFELLLPSLDWVGFDVKAPFHTYSRITGAERSGADALASLRLLLECRVPYEIRTTVHPALLTLEDMLELRDQLLSLGVKHYAIQRFCSQGVRPELLPPVPEFSLPDTFGRGFFHFAIR